MRFVIAAVVALIFMSHPAVAQAPELSELAQEKLEKFDALIENVSLKAALLNAQMVSVQQERAEYLKSIARDGYTVEKGSDGQWRYVKLEEPPPE